MSAYGTCGSVEHKYLSTKVPLVWWKEGHYGVSKVESGVAFRG
jgi:hypothetical protein